MRKFYSPILTGFFVIISFLATGIKHIYTEDGVFEPIENSDTASSSYLESSVNTNCTVTFVNEGSLDRVLCRYDVGGYWSNETDIDSGQSVTKDVSEGQIWQIWNTGEDDQIEEWTINCSGGSYEYNFGDSDDGGDEECCQSHGDHDHISGLYLRYVGPTSPATIEFSTQGYSNTSYSGTHSFDDFILIEADPNASGDNNRFGTNSEFTVNGSTFDCHTSCSEPTNVGYGISSTGDFVPNPNPNSSDIMFIIEGIATAGDGWCGVNTNTCGTLDGIYIHDSSDGAVVYGPINNSDNLILTQTILPDSYYLEAHTSGNIESITWIVDNNSHTDNDDAYTFPENGNWSVGLSSHNIIVNSFSQDNGQGDNCGSLYISFDVTEDCDFEASVSSNPNSVCDDGGNDNGGDEECCQSHGDDHDHISGLYLRYVGPTSPATIEFETDGYSNTTYSATHSLNDFILIEADPNASGDNNRFGTNSHFTVNGVPFDCHTSCSDPTNVGDGISSNGNFVSNPNPNALDIMFIIEGIATADDGWCGDQDTSTSCDGSAIANVTAGQAPYTYLWSNGQTTQEATGLCAGLYSVTITAVNGCLSTYDVEVSDDINGPEATLEVSENTVCDGEGSEDDSNNCSCQGGLSTVTFLYTGASGVLGGAYDHHDNTLGEWTLQYGEPYTFNFDNANHTQWHEHNDPQFWTEEEDWVPHGTLDSSCDSQVIGEMFGPFTIIGYTDLEGNSCGTEAPGPSCDGTIDLTVTSGAAPYTYLWSNGSTNQDLSGLCAGEYSVVITDSNGCSSTYSVNVSCEELCVFPEANASATQASCIDQTGTITFNFSDSSDRTNIEFSIDGGVTYPYNFSDLIGSSTITGIAPGLYDIWVRWGNDQCPLDIEDVTIILIGTVDPVVTCPNNVIVNCTDAISTEFNTWLNGFSFSGGSEPINETYTVTKDGQGINFPPAIPSDACAGAIIVITYRVTDACDQDEQCSSTFTLTSDTEYPEITDVSDYSLDGCNSDWPTLTTPWADNCSVGGVLTAVAGDVSTLGCSQSRVYTISVEDTCGNPASATTIVSRTYDVTLPTIVDIADYSLEGCNSDWPTLTTPWADNCSAGGVLTAIAGDVSTTGCSQSRVYTFSVEDACGNPATATTIVSRTYDVTPPLIICPEDMEHECDESPIYGEATATDACNDVTLTFVESEDSDECITVITRTWTATDLCGNSSSCIQTITIVDTTAPEFANLPDAEIEIFCQDELPEVPEVTVTDNCDQLVEVVFVEEFNGFNPDPEADTNCEGVQPLNAQADWAMSLFGLPNSGGESNYNVVFSQVSTYEDTGNGQEAIITGTFYDQANPNGGWHINIPLVNGVNWADWSSSPGHLYKDDYDLAGDSYEDWIYYIIDSNGAYMEGWGDFEGSYLEIAHIPIDFSVGWQYGVGANNVGPNLGLGGWLYYEGIYADSSQDIDQAVSGAGDIAVDINCCPTYLFTRIWSAIDCSGNESSFSQEITVLGTDAQEPLFCLADFNFDGNRSSADLGILLGDYGCFSGNCQCDLNGDGFTTSTDVSVFLTLFGQPCDNQNED